jgi:hypothetical protein
MKKFIMPLKFFLEVFSPSGHSMTCNFIRKYESKRCDDYKIFLANEYPGFNTSYPLDVYDGYKDVGFLGLLLIRMKLLYKFYNQ